MEEVALGKEEKEKSFRSNHCLTRCSVHSLDLHFELRALTVAVAVAVAMIAASA
jgi:hypothetical protein